MQKPPLAPKSILKKPPPSIPAKPTMSPPHRRVVLPVSYPYHHQKNQPPKRVNLCRFVSSFLLVILLIFLASLAVVCGLFYLWFAPKLPVFELRAVHLNRFDVSARPDGSSYIRTGASVWVEAKNNNEKPLDFYHGGSRMEIFFPADVDDVELGSASLPEFAQVSGNVTVLRFVGGGKETVDAETGRRLNAAVKSGAVKSGAVKFEVGVKTEVGFGVGRFVTWRLPADVACGGVSLKRLEDGPLTCRIK